MARAPFSEARLVADDGRSRRPAVAVQERLGEGADDDRLPHLVAPRAEVPPLDVAGTKAVVGRAQVGLDPVQEPEPVALLRDVALDALDRLDETTAVRGVDVELPVERLHRGQPRGDGLDEEHRRSAVARDPERGASRARALVPTAREQEGAGNEKRTLHLTELERTAFGAVARTRPRCLPTQPRPERVFTRRPSTTSTAPAAGVATPWSFWETTE